MTTKTPSVGGETYALISYRDPDGSTRLASVIVLDWDDDDFAMIAMEDGVLVPVYEVAGFVCLTGSGVVPGRMPVGTMAAGMARALIKTMRQNR